MSAEGWGRPIPRAKLHWFRGGRAICRARWSVPVSLSRLWPRLGSACGKCWNKRQREELHDLEADARRRGVTA